MKKVFLRLLGVFLALLLASNVFAVNTVTYTAAAGVVEITDIDSDWSWSDSITWATTTRIDIISIQFNPGGADDECIILDQNAAGAAIFEVLTSDVYDQRIKYFPKPNPGYMPFLDFDIGTYSSGAKIIIILGK